MKEPITNPYDFVLAAILLVALNLVTCAGVDRPGAQGVRLESHARVDAYVAELDPALRYDWVFFGDSRSLRLNGGRLCEDLPGESNLCLNASTTSGDWLTAFLLYRELRPHMKITTGVVIFVSDYWLEGRDTGLIPGVPEYATLGSPLRALESHVPLSFARRNRIDWLRGQLEAIASSWQVRIAGPSFAEERKQIRAEADRLNVFRSNVDTWFLPISESERAERLREARASLQHMIDDGYPPILVNLPNLGRRNAYVDEHHPGRRARFRRTLDELADALELVAIDLEGRISRIDYFKDFHHLNEKGRDALIPILDREITNRLARVSGGGDRNR